MVEALFSSSSAPTTNLYVPTTGARNRRRRDEHLPRDRRGAAARVRLKRDDDVCEPARAHHTGARDERPFTICLARVLDKHQQVCREIDLRDGQDDQHFRHQPKARQLEREPKLSKGVVKYRECS